MSSTSSMLVLLLLSLAGQGWSISAPYSCCDSTMVATIKEYWAQNGKPTGVASAVEGAGTVVLAYSTADLLDSFGKDNIQCGLGLYPPGEAIYTFYLKDGTSFSTEQGAYIDDNECTISTTDGTSVAYVITVDCEHGVFPYYICSPNGEKGAPQGGIVVSKDKYGVDGLEAAECSALEATKCVGLDLSVKYPDECFCI